MGKTTKELSNDLRQRIINVHKLGNSYSIISNQLAIPRSTVQSIIKFKQFGTTENLPGCGRKPKLSLRTAYHKVDIKPRVVLKDIVKSLDMAHLLFLVLPLYCSSPGGRFEFKVFSAALPNLIYPTIYT